MSSPEHTPLDASDVAAELSDDQAGDDPAVTDDTPQDPLSRLWRMCMAPAPPPTQAGELFDPELHWSAYINSGIQGMSKADGTPAILMFVLGIAMMASDRAADGGTNAEAGVESGAAAADDEDTLSFEDVA